MSDKPMGIVLWKGKSPFDGERIMVIATGINRQSENRKTGDMIQTYIMRRDIHPMLARRLGEDKSVCGDCKHKEQSTCYVNLCHGPIAVFKAFHDGSYKDFEPSDVELFRDRYFRIGSYGDPAAVPFEVWSDICKVSAGWTGYTHQWKTCDQRYQDLCMASVDSIKGYMKEFHQAQAMGWRTFRVRESEDNPLMECEFVCPASKERGAIVTCEKCCGCAGNDGKRSKSPVIMLHADSPAMGVPWRTNRYLAIMKKIKNKKAWRRDYKGERNKFRQVCKF